MTSAAALAAQRLVIPRSGRELLYTILILISLPFFFVSGPAWLANGWSGALSNFAHIGFFALLTQLIGTRAHLGHPANMVRVTIAVVLLSAIIELIQTQVGRTASWHDGLRNVTGAWLVLFWLHRPSRWVWSGRVISASLFAMELMLIGSAGLARYQMVTRLPVLSDLESPAELQRWTGLNSEVTRSSGPVSEGRFALKAHLGKGEYSGMALTRVPADWTNYEQLFFDLYNPQSDNLYLTLRIHDFHHEVGETSWSYGDRFNQKLRLEPGWNHYNVPLAAIETAPQDRKMNLRQIRELRLFATEVNEPKAVYADNFRLR